MFSIGFLMLLAACSSERRVTSLLKINAPTDARAMELLQATERVMNRKVAAAKIKNGYVTALPTGLRTGTLSITVEDSAAAENVRSMLVQPFTFDIRVEHPGAAASGNVATSSWIPTTLTGSALESVRAIGNRRTGAVSIELNFTLRGRAMLQSVFSENQGKSIGIFVRGLLVSTLSVRGEKTDSRVIIEGIPSAPVAEIFADDVNVGLGVTIIPAS
jgi:hypothetical protein